MIIVATNDPQDAPLVAGALGLLERWLRTNGQRLPETLRCPVTHVSTAPRRQDTTPLGDVPRVEHDDRVLTLLTYREAAAQLRVSERTIQRYVADGSLAARQLGRRRVIDAADLQSFAAQLPTTTRTAS